MQKLICFIIISDGWTTDDLQYLWKTKEPVQIVPDLHLPRFTLEKYISDYCNIKTNTGTYHLVFFEKCSAFICRTFKNLPSLKHAYLIIIETICDYNISF